MSERLISHNLNITNKEIQELASQVSGGYPYIRDFYRSILEVAVWIEDKNIKKGIGKHYKRLREEDNE